jgi:uncharacterized membrane protein YkgB
MSDSASEQTGNMRTKEVFVPAEPYRAPDILVRLAGWLGERNIPFIALSVGTVVMLLWAGSFKMTEPGSEAITPLVTNSPLISWHFKVFGPKLGADLIGLTEITAALLIVVGYFRPKAGLVGGCITAVMFFITSTMVISTPGTTTLVHGVRYLSFTGLFLFKDLISLGVSLYLIDEFGNKIKSATVKGSR